MKLTPSSGVKRIENKEKKLLANSNRTNEHKESRNKAQKNNGQHKSTKNQKKNENNQVNTNSKLKVIPLGGLGEIE